MKDETDTTYHLYLLKQTIYLRKYRNGHLTKQFFKKVVQNIYDIYRLFFEILRKAYLHKGIWL